MHACSINNKKKKWGKAALTQPQTNTERKTKAIAKAS